MYIIIFIYCCYYPHKDKANAVYETEQTRCPPRSQRLAMSLNPSTFRLHRGGSKPTRSLLELTADPQLFLRLHTQFTWIIKAGSNRLTERLLEGPPTEDSVIDLEKQEGQHNCCRLDVIKKIRIFPFFRSAHQIFNLHILQYCASI